MPIVWLFACATDAASANQAALSGTLPVAEALDLCAGAGAEAESCAAGVVRSRADATEDDCGGIATEKWRSECFFGVAERRAKARDRFAALRTCGQAGSFYAECLYHAWTYELQGTVLHGVPPADQLSAPVETIRFWGSIQSVAGEATEQLWSDWWYLALHGRVADLADCTPLEPDARRRCEVGTRNFVARSVADFLQQPGTDRRVKDRICRGGIEQAQAGLPDFYRPNAELDEVVLTARTLACGASRTEMQRPWNPIFLEWRAWVAG